MNVSLALLLVTLCAATPVFVGTFTGYGATDIATREAVTPVFDAIRASILAVNRSGGIASGRELVLVECECQMHDSFILSCAENFTRDYPSMVAWVGVFTDLQIALLQDIVEANDVLIVGPAVFTSTYRSTFSKHWIFTSAEQSSKLRFLSAFVQKYHVKRIGFMIQDIPGSQETVQAAELLLRKIGVESTGSFFVDKYWRNTSYFEWLARRPQAIFLLLSAGKTTLNPTVDLLSRIVSGTSGVNDDVYLFAIDWFMPVAELALGLLELSNVHYNASRGRLMFSLSNPSLTDHRYLAMRRASEELAAYWNSSTSHIRSGTFATFGAAGWIEMQVLIAALRTLNPQNITKDSLREKIFDSGVFEVDDLLFGTYSKPCPSIGMRAELGELCSCNEGYRTSETYAYDSTIFGKLRVIPELRTSYPKAQCSPGPTTVTRVVVFLTLEPSSTILKDAAKNLLIGLAAQEIASEVTVRASFETILSPSTDVAFSESVANIMAERYVSILFGFVLAASSQINVSGYPLIDPLLFPAELTRPYSNNVVYVSASLNQELFVLAEYVVVNLRMIVHVVARGSQAKAVIAAVRASALTFGSELASAVPVVSSSGAAFLPDSLPLGRIALFAIGLTNDSDVRSLLALLAERPEAVAAVAFTELSVLYQTFEQQCALTTPPTCGQILFATNLRNWNAPQLANDSTLLADYFAAVNDSLRSPLSLRGFVNSAAIRRVMAEMGTTPFLPAPLLQKWYSIGVVTLSSSDYLGPYSSLPCSTATRADTLCEVNAGARVVRVMLLADVTTNATTTTTRELLVRTFTSPDPPYAIPLGSSGLTPAQVAGIVVSSVVAGLSLCAAVAWSHMGKRNNRYAPTDPNKPVTLVFTDIESSTSLWARAPVAMAAALDRHHEIIRELILKHKCYEVKTIGDSFMIASEDPKRAVQLAVELQFRLFSYDWGTTEIDEAYLEIEAAREEQPVESAHTAHHLSECWNGLRVRVGIHTGLVGIKLDETTKGFDYYGNAVNIAARTESFGSGGQVIITQDVVDSFDSTASARYDIRALGSVILRGAREPTSLFDVATVPGRVFSRIEVVDRVATPTSSMHDHALVETYGSGVLYMNSTEDECSSSQRGSKWTESAESVITTMISLLGNNERVMVLRMLCAKWHTVLPTGEKTADDAAAIGALARRIDRVLNKKFLGGSLYQRRSSSLKPAD